MTTPHIDTVSPLRNPRGRQTGRLGMLLIASPILIASLVGTVQAATQQDVADYVRDNIMGGSLEGVTLWMTDTALNDTHIARDRSTTVPDESFPYPLTWLVMIDDNPDASWTHPCRWVFVNDDLSEHTGLVDKSFPPTVWAGGGAGPQVDFFCTGGWGGRSICRSTATPVYGDTFVPGADKDCLYAVLISGGWDAAGNYEDYKVNLGSMYRILRQCGYPKDRIWVYYENGSALDFDNLDQDSNNATESDVNGAASEANISARLSALGTAQEQELQINGA